MVAPRGPRSGPALPRPRSVTFVVVVVAVMVVLTLVLVAMGLFAAFDPFGRETVDRSGPAVLEQIRELQEFTAAEGSFTQDVDLEEDARYLPSVLAGRRVVALVTGTVRATVDFSQLDDDAVAVDDDRTTIRVMLPEPRLNPAEIDEESARVIARDRGVFDRVGDFFASNPIDDGPLYRAAREKVDAAAAESDLLEEGRATTDRWLTTFLGAAGFDEVVVEWQEAPV